MKRIFLTFAAVMITVFCVLAVPTTARSNCAIAQEGMNLQKVPNTLVGLAYLIFRTTNTVDPKLEAELSLKLEVIYLKDGIVDAHQRYMIRENWRAGFRKLFDDVAAWREQTLKKSSAGIYAMALNHRALAAKDSLHPSIRELHQRVSRSLLHCAWANKYPPAVFDSLQYGFLERDKTSLKYTQEQLWELANEGYAPAAINLAERYMTGRDFPKNMTKGFYWFLRAEKMDGALSGQLIDTRKSVGIQQSLTARYWFLMGNVPKL